MRAHLSSPLPACALITLSALASAQDFNIDVSDLAGVPATSYGAALGAGGAGFWNVLAGGPPYAFPLTSLGGTATGVTTHVTAAGNGAGDFFFNNAGTTGDDGMLMDDCQDVGNGGATPPSETTWTFSGLNDATYDVIVYAWAPDSATFVSFVSECGTGVSTMVQGGWPGGFAPGTTHAVLSVPVSCGGMQICVDAGGLAGNFASVNGFQIRQSGPSGPTVCQSSGYRISGRSTGADWTIRISQGTGATAQSKTATIAGIPGATPDDFRDAFVSAINGFPPPPFVPPVSASATGPESFKISYTDPDFVFEVGDAAGTSFCTVTPSTPCSFNPLIEQIESSSVAPGNAICFCDGANGAPPCGNAGAPAAGCANSSGSGAQLSATGSNGTSASDFTLVGHGLLPGQPGLFFQGESLLSGGAGVPFGDGRRCCGVGIVRLEIALPDSAGTMSSSVDVVAAGAVSPGDLRCYQAWYRDPSGPCGSTFNLSNAYLVHWTL